MPIPSNFPPLFTLLLRAKGLSQDLIPLPLSLSPSDASWRQWLIFCEDVYIRELPVLSRSGIRSGLLPPPQFDLQSYLPHYAAYLTCIGAPSASVDGGDDQQHQQQQQQQIDIDVAMHVLKACIVEMHNDRLPDLRLRLAAEGVDGGKSGGGGLPSSSSAANASIPLRPQPSPPTSSGVYSVDESLFGAGAAGFQQGADPRSAGGVGGGVVVGDVVGVGCAAPLSSVALSVLENIPLGFSTGDLSVDWDCKCLKVLHLAALSDLQHEVNNYIGAMQDLTARQRDGGANWFNISQGKVGR